MTSRIEIEGIKYEVCYCVEEGYPGSWMQPPDDPEIIVKEIKRDDGNHINNEEFEQVRMVFINEVDVFETIEVQRDRNPFDL